MLNSLTVIASRRSRKSALHVQELVALRGARALGCQPDHEALEIAPELQQHPLTCEVDRGDLNAVAWPHQDERVLGEPAHGLVHRHPPDPGDPQQILDRQELPGLQLAVDDQLLDPLIGEIDEAHPAAPGGSRRGSFVRRSLCRPSYPTTHACLPGTRRPSQIAPSAQTFKNML